MSTSTPSTSSCRGASDATDATAARRDHRRSSAAVDRGGWRRREGAGPVRPHRDGDARGLGRCHLPRWRRAGGSGMARVGRQADGVHEPRGVFVVCDVDLDVASCPGRPSRPRRRGRWLTASQGADARRGRRTLRRPPVRGHRGPLESGAERAVTAPTIPAAPAARAPHSVSSSSHSRSYASCSARRARSLASRYSSTERTSPASKTWGPRQSLSASTWRRRRWAVAPGVP